MSAVICYNDIAEIPMASWTRLVASIPSPFYKYDFLSAYQTSRLGGNQSSVYLTLNSTSRTADLTAALPAYLVKGTEIASIFGIGMLETPGVNALISHFPHCYDSVLPVSGLTVSEALPQLWEGLRYEAETRGARAFGLINVEQDSDLHRVTSSRPGVVSVNSAARWRLSTIQVPTLTDYYRTLSGSTRKTLLSYQRRAERDGATTLVSQYGSGSDDVEDVIELCVGTARKHSSSYYAADPLRRLLSSLREYFVIRILLDDVTLAASICFLVDGVLHTWAGGTARAMQRNWSPNCVLFHQELKFGYERGVRQMEFGRRSDDFKQRHRLERANLVACLDIT